MSWEGLAFQALDGLSSASGLFFVAAGLSLIFGVTRIINIAHGSFYMLGTYIAVTLVTAMSGALGFWGGIVLSAISVAVLGAAIEFLLLRRIYSSPELFQLLATFAHPSDHQRRCALAVGTRGPARPARTRSAAAPSKSSTAACRLTMSFSS